jgi:hypothetical protein
MNINWLLSAASAIAIMGSTAAFAQSATNPELAGIGDVIMLKPGQTLDYGTSSVAPVTAARSNSDVGIVTMKPGETVHNASRASLGSVSAGATAVTG